MFNFDDWTRLAVRADFVGILPASVPRGTVGTGRRRTVRGHGGIGHFYRKSSTVKTPPTGFLRVVHGDDPSSLPDHTAVADWNSICRSFSRATGVRLKFRTPADKPLSKAPLWCTDVPAQGHQVPGQLVLLRPTQAKIPAERINEARRLAEAIGSMASDLRRIGESLRQREAELATAIPLVVLSHNEQQQLAKRFEAILRGGADAIGCSAAAMYILDDDTTSLKIRSHAGLDDQRLTDPPRSLRQCKADVQALAGHAVVLSQADQSDQWAVPEVCAAAICVPISSANMPLGTLWMFSRKDQAFTDEQVNLVEIIAGRMATELEREILLREQGRLGIDGHVSDAIEWQQALLPRTAPKIGDWEIAARPSTRSRLHGDFYQWRSAVAGRLELTLASADRAGVPAALTCATLNGLSRQLGDASPAERMQIINEAIWESSAGDLSIAAFTGALDEETGRLTFCSCGTVNAYVIRPHSWEAIAQSDSHSLGKDESVSATVHETYIQPDDLLLVLSGRPRKRPRIAENPLFDVAHYAEAALHHSHLAPVELTTLLASLWEPENSAWEVPPAMLIAKHRI